MRFLKYLTFVIQGFGLSQPEAQHRTWEEDACEINLAWP